MTCRLPTSMLLWWLTWLLLTPVGPAQAAEPAVIALEEAAAVLQLAEPAEDGLADDDEDFAPSQDIYARTNHREDLSGFDGEPLATVAVCGVACPTLRFHEAERSGAGLAGFHLNRALHPRAPPRA